MGRPIKRAADRRRPLEAMTDTVRYAAEFGMTPPRGALGAIDASVK